MADERGLTTSVHKMCQDARINISVKHPYFVIIWKVGPMSGRMSGAVMAR